MTSDKKNISLLADIFVKSGLSNNVLSPGSRNAPIINSFVNRKEIAAFSIVDERSAAFFALGIALNTNKTVAIACTSGSAALNYSSAISEAYYQKIPLLVLTADRPSKLIDIGDGQTIKQKKVYSNFIKKSYELPEIQSEESFLNAEQIINKAIHNTMYPEPGPVHINIPFDEPIYGLTDEEISGDVYNTPTLETTADEVIRDIISKITSSDKVMIIAGQQKHNGQLNNYLSKLSEKENIVVLTETTSNLNDNNFIDTIDNVISTFSKKEEPGFAPDVIVSIGGQVVSKMIKKYLRNNQAKFHWHISPSGEKLDTYFCLTKALKYKVSEFLQLILKEKTSESSNFSKLWKNKKQLIDNRRDSFLQTCEYSDLQVFKNIVSYLPDNCICHLGNSTPVRYSQLFGSRKNVVYESNRGVSGIDGQVSTAAGYSYYSDKINILITGDLGFLYDSNGLMNHYLKSNFKIIVINNQGGGIFRFIPGPDTTPNLERFFEARHNWNAKHISAAFGVNYLSCTNASDLKKSILDLIKSTEVSLLEIFTPGDINGSILRDYFNSLK